MKIKKGKRMNFNRSDPDPVFSARSGINIRIEYFKNFAGTYHKPLPGLTANFCRNLPQTFAGTYRKPLWGKVRRIFEWPLTNKKSIFLPSPKDSLFCVKKRKKENLNPLNHGRFSDPYLKVLWEGGKNKFLDFFSEQQDLRLLSVSAHPRWGHR